MQEPPRDCQFHEHVSDNTVQMKALQLPPAIGYTALTRRLLDLRVISNLITLSRAPPTAGHFEARYPLPPHNKIVEDSNTISCRSFYLNDSKMSTFDLIVIGTGELVHRSQQSFSNWHHDFTLLT